MKSKKFDNILIEDKDGWALVTINRPSKLNALNLATIKELHIAFKNLEETPEVKTPQKVSLESNAGVVKKPL